MGTMAHYIDLPVFLEDLNEVITLKVFPEDAERARNDSQYLARLVNEHKSLQLIEQDTEKAQEQSTAASDQYTAPSETTGYEESTASSENEATVFIWTPQCVHLLLSLYEEHEAEFTAGTQRHKKIWEKIALLMKKHGYIVTGYQCQSKLNGLKKTYKKILDHNNVSGNDRMSWPYFERMNEIFGSSSWVQPTALASEAGPMSPINTVKNNETRTPKKRCLDIFDKHNIEIEKRQKERKEWHEVKAQKYDAIMAQKERQHKEKMDLMHALLKAISNNANKG